jgi:hypothetical protein
VTVNISHARRTHWLTKSRGAVETIWPIESYIEYHYQADHDPEPIDDHETRIEAFFATIIYLDNLASITINDCGETEGLHGIYCDNLNRLAHVLEYVRRQM